MDDRQMRCRATAALASIFFALPAAAAPNLSGMWSDPPNKIEDGFCIFWCSDFGLQRLNALLDDPANDKRPIRELYLVAARAQYNEYVRPRLTQAGLEQLGLDAADDPAFRDCEPYAFAREIFVPHQLKIEQHGDRVDMLYGEWTIHRTIHLNAPAPPADTPLTAMGYSTGHYDGDALVIVTSHLKPNLASWGLGLPVPVAFDGRHSDQLRVEERYTRSPDGNRLLLTATLEDQWALREPVVLKKVWGWAPDQKIAPYESCEKPTEFTRGTSAK
jgi:hypothetical protein